MNAAKVELVNSWLLKAEHDLIAARKLSQGDDRVLDVAIYHCQQAAEKAVKAFLIASDVPFEKIHDIKTLMSLAQPISEIFENLLERGDQLSDYAIEFRYPGDIIEPEEEEFQAALGDAETILRMVEEQISNILR